MQPDKNIFESVIKITDNEFKKLELEQQLANENLLKLFETEVLKNNTNE